MALQRFHYASDRFAVLMIFQAIDAAGKDGAIRHVMSGVNPQGCQAFRFKHPSAPELEHDFLWRTTRSLPERGRIGIFNRSYYEEVLIVRVDPTRAAVDTQETDGGSLAMRGDYGTSAAHGGHGWPGCPGPDPATGTGTRASATLAHRPDASESPTPTASRRVASMRCFARVADLFRKAADTEWPSE